MVFQVIGVVLKREWNNMKGRIAFIIPSQEFRAINSILMKCLVFQLKIYGPIFMQLIRRQKNV